MYHVQVWSHFMVESGPQNAKIPGADVINYAMLK